MAGMVVKNNMSALNTLNVLNMNHSQLSKSLAKVSSGMRINGAADDASGYAISERMRVQIRGLEQDNRNTQNGNSLLKVAEGAVSSTVDILKTLKEKVINAANDTNTDEDRATIQKELDQSIDQINDNANVTYNGKYLVDGTKNSQGSATYTALTNTRLSTATSGGTALTQLCDRAGTSLGILSTDSVTVSYVRDGKTYSTTYDVGNTSLQNIFKYAEDIDQNSTDFATEYNAAIAKINGVTNPAAVTQAANDAQAWVTTTNGIKNTASGLLSTYNTLVGNLQSAYSSFNSAVANEISSPTVITPAQATGLQNDWNTWKATSGISTEGGTSYADTSTVSSYTWLNIVANGASGVGPVAAVSSAYSAYNAAYNALNNFITNNPYSGLNTPSAPNISALGMSYTQTYDTTSYANYASSATDVYNEAVSVNNSIGGPKILSSSAVGLSRAGDTVYTSTRENAVSVLANNSGVTGQIAGFTVSITDSEGNVRKTANASLDAWEETVRAENESKNDDSIVLQTGTKANQSIKVALTDMRSEALGLKGNDGQTLNIGTQKKANAAISVLDNAIQKALDEQTKIGSIQSRLEYTSANLTTATENVQASESAIRDADMAKEMTEYTKNNVLLQTSQSMLAQANQSSSAVLGLLQ